MWARLTQGQPFQVVLTLAVLLVVGLGIGLGVALHSSPVTSVSQGIWTVALVLVWLVGVTGWARGDRTGVRWRYFVPRSFSWEQIERVELTPFLAFGSGRPRSVVLTVAGREHPVVPSRGCGRHLAQFGKQVAAMAEERGIRVRVEDDPFWQR